MFKKLSDILRIIQMKVAKLDSNPGIAPKPETFLPCNTFPMGAGESRQSYLTFLKKKKKICFLLTGFPESLSAVLRFNLFRSINV